MSRSKLIQILQYIGVWVVIYIFSVYVLDKSFIDVVLKYWLYFLVVTVSYFYYYSIQYDTDKKYELIRNLLVYGNLYVFLHVFFRPLLNISHELFMLLGLIILGMWGTTKMRSRWKYLLQCIGLILSLFIVLSGIFYFYPDKPDIEGFISSKGYEIVLEGVDDEIEKDDAYVSVKDSKRSNDYNIVPGFVKKISENCKVSYPSIKKSRNEKLVITTPEGRLFLVFPQSEVQLEFEGKKMIKLSKLVGKVTTFSGMFQDDIDMVGEMENIDNEQDTFSLLNLLNEKYKYELVSYLKNQISDSNISLANNTIMYNIDGKILSVLARMFPVSFSKNLKNYNEFMYYFSLVEGDDVNLQRFYKNNSSGMSMFSFLSELMNDLSVGINNIYLGKKE